ncbi:MAG TPA: hypothetical protein VMW16_17010 [Sedimentisphaerales bacterium]|nr:hypothetical protein [Sedimentisphaerales bacterium]
MRRKDKSHRGRRKFFALLFFMRLLFGASEATSGVAGEPEFVATEIYQATGPVFGLGWGDFDPLHDGMEVACLLQYGLVLQLSPNIPSWPAALRYEGETDAFTMKLRPTIGIGDVHSGYAGNEVVACGGGGSSMVTVVFYDPAVGWSHEVLFDNTGWVGGSWGARVGDYDPRRTGDEILHIYEGASDTSTGRIFREVAGLWEEQVIWGGGEYVEVGMDSAAGDFNPDHPGPEIFVITEGSRFEILPPEGNSTGMWPRRSIGWGGDESVGWVAQIADVDSSYAGNEVVYGTRYSNRIVMLRHDVAGVYQQQVLLTGNATEPGYGEMLDIAVGDILPMNAGLEILGVDYTGSVYLVRRVEDAWQGRVIWQDPNSLYAVIAGDFLPARSGDEILVGGESGTIRLLTLTFADSLSDDGIVNFRDFAELACYWLVNERGADIGPWPVGDGIVDMLDVAVVAENWLQRAYWAE